MGFRGIAEIHRPLIKFSPVYLVGGVDWDRSLDISWELNKIFTETSLSLVVLFVKTPSTMTFLRSDFLFLTIMLFKPFQFEFTSLLREYKRLT